MGFEQNDWYMSLYKKYRDMFEINLSGTRIIVLCRADLIGDINTPSTKTKYPFRCFNTTRMMEYMDVQLV